MISKAFFLHGPVFPHGTPFGKSSPQLNKVFVCNRNDFRHLLYVILSLINCLPTYAQLTINSNLLVTWDIHCHRPLLSVNCCRSWCTVYIYNYTHIYAYISVCVCHFNVFIIVDCHYDIRFRLNRGGNHGRVHPGERWSNNPVIVITAQSFLELRLNKHMAFFKHLRTFMIFYACWSTLKQSTRLSSYLMHVGLALMLRPKSHSYEPKLGNGTAMAVGGQQHMLRDLAVYLDISEKNWKKHVYIYLT